MGHTDAVVEPTALQVDLVLSLVRAEVMRAQQLHRPMSSFHDGWAVIYEEFIHEMAGEVFKKQRDPAKLEEECVQTAAMCVRFVLDLLRDQGQL